MQIGACDCPTSVPGGSQDSWMKSRCPAWLQASMQCSRPASQLRLPHHLSGFPGIPKSLWLLGPTSFVPQEPVHRLSLLPVGCHLL